MGKLEELYEPVLIKDADDIGSNPSSNTPLTEIAQARLERRAVLRGFVSTAVVAGMGGTLTSKIALAAAGSSSTLGFQSIPQTITENHAMAPGYTAQVLIRWGDKLLPGAPEFDPMRPATPRPSSSATTATSSATSRCRAARTTPSTGSCTSTTSTRARS